MIILDATNRKLQIKLAGAVSTNQLPVVASYVDVTTSTYVPITNTTQTNNTTEVDFVAAPAASTQRQIKFISVNNADTATRTVSIIYNDNSTQRLIVKVTILTGETMLYTDGEGWRVIDANGKIKITTPDGQWSSITGGVDGDLPYFGASNLAALLNKDTNATRYLSNQGTSNRPSWNQVNLANGVTGTLPIANGGLGNAVGALPLLAKNFTPASNTATTSEELLHSHQIAASKVAADDIMEVLAIWNYTNSANNKTHRIYINTSNSLGGATLLATVVLTTQGNTWHNRHFLALGDTTLYCNSGAANSQISGYNSGTALATTTVTVPSLSAGFWILISGQKANSGETNRVDASFIKTWR